jgi:hypothetical protein
MREGEGEKRALYPPPAPRRPERSEERRWSSPTPLTLVPPQDAGKVLKQILDRLDAMEKRLEKNRKIVSGERAPPIKDAELVRNRLHKSLP